MSDWLFALLVDYGAPLLALVTLASCIALPVPASLVMLAAGAFAASGDLPAVTVAIAALTGALLGDQLGFFIGSRGRTALRTLIEAYPKRAAILARASDLLRHRGGIGVFLSRWLVSPLGPYVNLAAGAAGLSWMRFTFWGALGEVVWVSLYVGLGFAFSDNFVMISEFVSNISGLLAALTLSIATGLWLLRVSRHRHRHRHRKEHS